MRFVLLGPIQARNGSGAVAVTARREQILLAMLLMRADRHLALAPLIDAVWPHDPPRDAPAQIHGTVYRLRRRLATIGLPATVVVHEPGGYRAQVDPAQVDLWEFRRLRDAARAAAGQDRPDEAGGWYRAALELWRGPAFAGVDSPPLRRAAAALDDERIQALGERIGLDLAAGAGADLVPELIELVGQHPYREALHGHLMLALHRADRHADALAAYRRIRDLLREELGTEPGSDLQRLHRAILARDPALTTVATRRPAAGSPTGGPGTVVPRQLPADVVDFTGRAEALARLDALLATTGDPPAPVVISAIDGMAGVGKTALAVHWAHRAADRFPDGQLYVNLRGFDHKERPMPAAEAVRLLLVALRVPPQHLPVDLQAQVGLYRSVLADRRVLIVLDNARDAEQVRPLLPGAGGCLALITSRNRLAGLVAAGQARPLTLDVFTAEESRTLLERRIGADRTAAEPEAVREIIESCARLPLALAIVAARAVTRDSFRIRALADELRASEGTWQVLGGGDAGTDLPTVFSWSYHALSPAAARTFRLLALSPGPEFTPPAAASLAGAPLPRAREHLAELTRANLVAEHRPGRYSCHDLLRTYAAGLVATIDAPADRDAAWQRLLDHLLHTAHAAARAIDPYRTPIDLDPAAPGSVVESVTTHQEAVAWFEQARATLVSAVARVAGTPFDRYAWQLGWTMVWFLESAGHWHDQVAVQAVALESARRQADPVVVAGAERFLGVAHARLRQWRDAELHLLRSLDLFAQFGDLISHACAHSSLGAMNELRGRYDEALHHTGQALALAERAGHEPAQASFANALGWCHALRGDYAPAIAHCERALAIHQRVDDPPGAAKAWDSLGFVHHQLGDHRRAVECYRSSLEQLDRCDNRKDRADTLHRLGDAHRALGAQDAADAAWRDALVILVELKDPGTDDIRAKLDRAAAG